MRLYIKEPDYDNVQNFKLFVSEERTGLTLAFSDTGTRQRQGRELAPAGRYVRFVAYDPSRDFTIRLLGT